MNSEEPMDFKEMRRLWCRQDDAPDDRSGKELMMEIQQRGAQLDRMIFWRDARETVAAVVISAAAVVASALVPGWLPKVGALALVASLAYICLRLARARRRTEQEPQPPPVTQGLRAELARVEAQRDILHKSRDWYVVPATLGGTLWAAGMATSLDLPAGDALRAVTAVLIAAPAIFTVVGLAVLAGNRLAIRRRLDPYRRKLENLLAEVEG